MTSEPLPSAVRQAGMGTYFRMGLTSILTVPLFLWLIYCILVSAFGALALIIASFKAAWAVGGLLGALLLPGIASLLILLPPIIYLMLFNALPAIWLDEGKTRGARIGSTLIALVAASLIASGLHWLGTRAVGWIADLNPCAAYAAGVTGSKAVDNCPAP